MEPANFHEHRQVEDNQLVMDSSCYGLSWNHNHVLNDTNFSAQELAELQQLARIKNEISVTGSCFELPNIISSEDFMWKNNNQFVRYNNVNTQDMLLKTFSNGCQIKNNHVMNPIPSFDLTNSYYRGAFSQIFPTLKFSNLNQPVSSFDMNLPALDSFGYPTFNGSFNYQPSLNAHNLGDLLKDNCLSYGVDQMHSKIAPTFIVETTTEAERPASNGMDAKAAPKANPTKKSKLDFRPSCTQLKVRKEKLGGRILALQQMVAPFGKNEEAQTLNSNAWPLTTQIRNLSNYKNQTDTASVLMEAIGYIKVLQKQVETLSMPYMNSTPQAGRMSTRGDLTNDGNVETKKDLRSRGLCLVPVSCLTYVTYGGGSVWPTP